jgi:hypothetical protein
VAFGSPQQVYVPPYFKRDGTFVPGYWRDNPQGRRLVALKGAKTFRDSGTFKPRK